MRTEWKNEWTNKWMNELLDWLIEQASHPFSFLNSSRKTLPENYHPIKLSYSLTHNFLHIMVFQHLVVVRCVSIQTSLHHHPFFNDWPLPPQSLYQTANFLTNNAHPMAYPRGHKKESVSCVLNVWSLFSHMGGGGVCFLGGHLQPCGWVFNSFQVPPSGIAGYLNNFTI